MAARPRRTERSKALRLACWNADGVRGRKLEQEHLLSQHSVDNCLLSETFLKPGQAFWLASYIRNPKNSMTAWCGTATLVRSVIVLHLVPVRARPTWTLLPLTLLLAGKPVKNIAA